MSGKEEVDTYIAGLDEPERTVMTQLRKLVVARAKGAIEVIAYKMPALRLNGHFFMSYDAYKNHYSLFPATDVMAEELGDEVAPYVKGRGTLQFPRSEPLPADLIKRIVALRLKDFS